MGRVVRELSIECNFLFRIFGDGFNYQVGIVCGLFVARCELGFRRLFLPRLSGSLFFPLKLEGFRQVRGSRRPDLFSWPRESSLHMPSRRSNLGRARSRTEPSLRNNPHTITVKAFVCALKAIWLPRTPAPG